MLDINTPGDLGHTPVDIPAGRPAGTLRDILTVVTMSA
jgi:hypothetical protein